MIKYDILILNGGKGTRVSKYTKNIPKCLIKFNKKPFLYHQLKLLKKFKIKNVLISTKYKSDLIRSYLTTSVDFINFKIVSDGAQFKGTGGATKKILKFMKSSFFILYGDSYPRFNLNKLKLKKSCMAIYKNNNKYDKSNVELLKKSKIRYFKEMPAKGLKYIDYGISYVNKSVFNHIDKNKYDLPVLFEKLSAIGGLKGHVVKNRFYEIGSYNGIREFKNYIKKNELY